MRGRWTGLARTFTSVRGRGGCVHNVWRERENDMCWWDGGLLVVGVKPSRGLAEGGCAAAGEGAS